MSEKEKLFHMIEQVSFGMDELRLFLDTHPHDENALSMYQKLEESRKRAVAEYQDKYDMICGYGVAEHGWNWNECPQPWM